MDEEIDADPQHELTSAQNICSDGYLLVLRYAAGSKSDSYVPHLVCEDHSVIRLHVCGENPFGVSSLRAFHGRFVRISGRWGARRRFIMVDLCEAKMPPHLA